MDLKISMSAWEAQMDSQMKKFQTILQNQMKKFEMVLQMQMANQMKKFETLFEKIEKFNVFNDSGEIHLSKKSSTYLQLLKLIATKKVLHCLVVKLASIILFLVFATSWPEWCSIVCSKFT